MPSVAVAIVITAQKFHGNQPHAAFVTEKVSTIYSPIITVDVDHLEKINDKLDAGLSRLTETFEEKSKDRADLILTPEKK